MGQKRLFEIFSGMQTKQVMKLHLPNTPLLLLAAALTPAFAAAPLLAQTAPAPVAAPIATPTATPFPQALRPIKLHDTRQKTLVNVPLSDGLPEDMPDLPVLFLAELPVNGTPEDIADYVLRTSVRAEQIKSPALRQIVRITLAQLEDSPRAAAAIRTKHHRRLGKYFYAKAVEALVKKDLMGVANATQIAIRCDPAHINARRVLAEVLIGLKHTDLALNTLSRGLHLIQLTDPDAAHYLRLYLKLLDEKKNDAEVLRLTDNLLRNRPELPATTRAALVLDAALANIRLGNYTAAINLLRDAKLTTFPARMAEATAYFYGGRPAEAAAFLERAVPNYRAQERDALLAQIVQFRAQTGQWQAALDTATQRVREFPENPHARIQRLRLLDSLRRPVEFEADADLLLRKHPDSTAVLLPLAGIAADRGKPALAERCRDQRRAAIGAPQGPDVFDCIVFEALLRAGRAKDALASVQQRRLLAPELVANSEGTNHALVATASFLTGDIETARRHLDSFLTEEPSASDRARIQELMMKRDGTEAADGTRAAAPKTAAEFTTLNNEIRRLSMRRRNISENSYLAVGRLLRFARMTHDALRVLEQGVVTHPLDAQLRADYISVRLASRAIAGQGYRKELLAEVEALLTMRRPNPCIWSEVSTWLATPALAANPRAAKLRPIVARLIRKDILPLDAL
jgi:hypothetical protein